VRSTVIENEPVAQRFVVCPMGVVMEKLRPGDVAGPLALIRSWLVERLARLAVVVVTLHVVLMSLACEGATACAESAADQRAFTAAESAAENCTACAADQRAASGSDAVAVVGPLRPVLAGPVVVGPVMAVMTMVVLRGCGHSAREKQWGGQKSCIDPVHVVLPLSASDGAA